MQPVIKRICTGCQAETYYAQTDDVQLEGLSGLPCLECGERAAVLTLNSDLPTDSTIVDSHRTSETPQSGITRF